jgi:formylglycine-generating enzyme required for sulfatase activity
VTLAAILTFAAAAHALTIPTVPVGNPGNADDPAGDEFGAVAYNYRIATTEVTNAQYAEFLNAKAAGDPLGLYNTSMGSSFPEFGGITRSGSSGSYTYDVIPGRGEMPVNYVSWYDAIRFANWLHNGQGAGDTETGAYTLEGGTATPSNGLSITRNPGATWFLTSDDEWYKAAYHKNDGATANYFAYPTSSDTAPTAEAPAGGSNSANWDNAVGDLTEVGAYTGSASPYGTFDQAGNLWEWTEAVIDDAYRGLRGSSWGDIFPEYMLSAHQDSNDPTSEELVYGFRVATVPEPASGVLAVIACGIVLWCRKRFR